MSRQKTTIYSESEMIEFGKTLAKSLSAPACVELVGDVGSGKTTITRGLAAGLGVSEPVTSPSFTISKIYPFPGGCLAHYDFYRLADPGLMSEDLLENINDQTTITVIEWSDSVSNLLPPERRKFTISLNTDGSRTITEEKNSSSKPANSPEEKT